MSLSNKVLKKHKLYFRDEKTGAARNLGKVNYKLFLFIIQEFVLKGGEYRYQKLNKGVNHWSKFKALPLSVPKELNGEFDKVTKKHSLLLSYDGTWKPLVSLIRFNDSELK